MSPNIYMIIILIIISMDFLTTLTISILDYNYKKNTPKFPSVKKDYVKSKRYLRTNIKFGMVKAAVDTSMLLIIIFTGILNNIDIFIRSFGFGPIISGILFFGVIGFASSIISIPFSIFRTFHIEKKYGFNNTTKKVFISDLIKSLLGWIIVGSVGVFTILYFFEKLGTVAWLYCWIFITIFQLFTMFIYPVLILPFFNKLKILKDSSLKETIKDYLDRNNINIKMDNIKIIDSSTRTNKSSAFLAGIGKNKRLVLSDTLLKNHTQEEILAVVAHEVGHLRMSHLIKKLLLYVVETFLMMLMLSIVIGSSNLFLAFGVESISVYLGLILFSIIYSPIAFVFSTISNYMSKKYEYDADNYAATTTSPEAMASALERLGSHNLTNPTPHPAKVFFHYTHPPIKNRIDRLKE